MSFANGTIVLAGLLTGSKSYGAETLNVAWRTDHDRGDPKEQTTRYNEDNSWRDEVADFAAALLENKPVVNGSSADALKTMETVYRIYCADPEWRRRFGLSDSIPEEVA